MKKLVTALSVASVLLMSGCEKNQTNEINNVLVMGTSANFPPFEYIADKNSNEIIGFDIDIAKQIAKDAGKQLKIMNMKFSNLIVALEAGEIDFIGAGMTITPERKKLIDFSQPYYEATQVVLMPISDQVVTTLDDIKSKKIAVQVDSTGHKIAKDISDNVTTFDSGLDAIMELKNGKADLVIFDNEPAKNLVTKHPEIEIIDARFEPEFYGFAVAKDNASLLKSINSTLENLKQSGEHQSLITKHIQ